MTSRTGRSLRPFRLVVSVLVLVAAGEAARTWAWRPLPLAGTAPADAARRVSGVLHVHTNLSDGGGTPEEVLAAARAAGLDFVAITDHNRVTSRVLEGWRDGLLVLGGTEISTTAGHVLALGIDEPAFRFSGDVHDALDDVRLLGGVAWAAHPTTARSELQWTGDDLQGGWGIEVLNGDSQWRSASWPSLALALFRYPWNPEYALLATVRPEPAATAAWDRLLARRPAGAIAGADAHQRVRVSRRIALPLPSYRAMFGLARTHVLLAAPLAHAPADARAVVDALGAGHAYVALDALAPGGGLVFTASDGAGRTWTIGESAPGATRVHAGGRMPAGTRLRLLCDGQAVAEREGELDHAVTRPGVYRLEAWVPSWDAPWAITNPITVHDEQTLAKRRAAAAWPDEAAAPEPTRSIDTFEGVTSFAAEFDPSSEMTRDVIDAGAGPAGGGAARIAFRLGAPGPGRSNVWCALVDRTKRDLSGTHGLTFRLRGDAVRRMWVQVRDENPASSDDGTEWWFASVRTSTDWRRVAVPFARLRSLNPATDGRLDLDRVRQIVFVVDLGAAEPGTRGTIWIDDLGTF